MAEIKNFPNNVDEYIGAQNVMKWLHGRTSGVFGADGNLSVLANDNMTVSVSDGHAWLSNAGGDGCVIWNDTEKTTGSKMTLPVGIADPALPRIDRVVASWDTIDYTALPEIFILRGIPASNPQPPALTNTTIKRQISLAQYRVAAAATKITASDITDERLDPSVCGLVTETVSIDTSVMQAQFLALLAQIQELLRDLTLGTAAMLRSVYDPQNKAKDIFLSISANSARYQAKYLLDGWEDASEEEKGKGWMYKQTVSVSAIDADAPAVTADSRFLPQIGTPKTGVAQTDEILKEALNVISDGVTTAGAGAVTTLVKEKPTTDIPVVWTLRTEV